MVKKEDLNKALQELENILPTEEVQKASEEDLDKPEGSDLGAGHMKEKLSDKAPKADKSPKPTKKSEAKDDEEDEEEETEEEEKNVKKKSFSETAPQEITTKIEVSDFLKSLVDHTGTAVDALREGIEKSIGAQQEQHDELAKSVEEIQENQAKIGVVLKAICERIGVIGNEPASEPKSVTVQKSSVSERQFVDANEEQQEKVFKSLSDNPIIAKAQIATAMCDLVKKGEALDTDVISFESMGHIRPEVANKLKAVLN